MGEAAHGGQAETETLGTHDDDLPSVTPARGLTSLRPLRHRSFALLWAAGLVSTIGSWMQTVAVGALVVSPTGTATGAVPVVAGAVLPLGLRSPVHTIARMLNPFNAPNMMQGIFHPGYHDTHQEAGKLLGQPRMAVIKGEGGEIERNPDIACLIRLVRDGEMSEEEWPPMFERRHIRSDELDLSHLMQVWDGSREDDYGIGAVIGTVAVTLYMMGRAATREEAEAQANTMWQARNKGRFRAAA